MDLHFGCLQNQAESYSQAGMFAALPLQLILLFSIVFLSLQTISSKYLHKLFSAAYLLFKFLLPYPFQVFPCPDAGMYCFLSGFMAFHA